MDKNISRTDEKRYEGYLKAELEAAAVYSALADTEADPQRARIFNELVEAELRHASRWAGKLGRGTTGLAPSALGVKGRLIKIAAGLFGTNRVLPILLRGEDKDIDMYAADPEAVDLVPEEQAHARILNEMSRTRGLGETHSRGVAASGGSLRAAVLGANDGLISNFSLVMGVAGGTGNPDFVLLAGVAGLLAGAFSMAAGEYVSVRSQRDLYENELRKEQIELSEWPEEEQAELELIYQAKGLSEEDSRRVASKLMADPKVALDTMAREELGLDPSQLGSPVAAAREFLRGFRRRRAHSHSALRGWRRGPCFLAKRGFWRLRARVGRKRPGAPHGGKPGVGLGAYAAGGRRRGRGHLRHRPPNRRVGRQSGIADPGRGRGVQGRC